MTKYHKEVQSKKMGIDDHHVQNTLVNVFIFFQNRLSYRPNFINYLLRDDMISDGIENCVQYMSNFNPEKSKNPFYNILHKLYTMDFIRRIQKREKTTIHQI